MSSEPPKKRTGKKSRDKGNRGERAVAKLLSEWWGVDIAKTPGSGGFRDKKFRDAWNAEGDIVCPDELFPFTVEVKWHEGWTLDKLLTSPAFELWDWWRQAKKQAREGKITLLVFKRNNMPWFGMMFEDEYPDHMDPKLGLTFFDQEDNMVRLFLFSDITDIEKDQWL